MKIIVNKLKPQTLEAFADEHGLTMIVNERDPVHMAGRWNPSKRFFARFDDTEVKNGPILSATFGNGASVEESIEDYMKEISGKYLVVGAFQSIPKYIQAPQFTSVK